MVSGPDARPFVQYNIGARHAELGVFAVDTIVLAIFVSSALRGPLGGPSRRGVPALQS